ncbi:MAG: hypothetical protein V4792_10010 [Pseudomonadota bacterium]
MAVSAGIYNAFAVKPKSVADFDAERADAEGNMLGLRLKRAQIGEYEQKSRSAAEVRAALMRAGPNAGYDDRIKALESTGLPEGYSQADALRKSLGDADKQKSEVEKNRAGTKETEFKTKASMMAYQAQRLVTVTSPQDAAAWYDNAAKEGHIPPEAAARGKAEIPQTPAEFADWKRRQMLAGMDSHQQAVTAETQRNNIANDARIKSEGTANRGVQMRGQDITKRGQDLTDDRARANIDLRRKELEQRTAESAPDSGLPVLGVPKPAVTPWSNQSNSKDANKVKLAEQTRGAKEIEKDVDAARKEKATADAAARFIELNKKVGTGSIIDRFGPTRAAQGMGADYSEMEAITARLAPAMREPGSGSTSDFDGKQFERATVGVDKPAKANENIAKGLIARAQQSQDYADFRNTYLEQNGTLSGADRYWKQYADSNPIFDPKAAGSFELNKGRKPWRDHFAGGAAPAAQPPAGAAPPASGAPARINSEADYSALPSGARYQAPDGSIRTKK